MAYLAREELEKMGFKALGKNVLISDRAAIYNADQIEIGDNSRIDDFCLISGKVVLERNVHLAAYTNVAGGEKGVRLGKFAGCAYGCHIFSQSDDYTGRSMCGPTVDDKYKRVTKLATDIGDFSILGTNALIFPGAHVAEGVAVGAMSMVTKPTEPWSVYFGRPAKRLKARKKGVLEQYEQLLADEAEQAARP